MQPRQLFKSAPLLLLLTCLLWSCGEQREVSKAPVISKKISIDNKTVPPQTKDAQQTADQTQKPDEKTAVDEPPTLASKQVYDPKDRLNPFIPLFREEKKQAPVDEPDKSKRKKRAPRTPLERIGLDQLKLVAIIRAPSGNKALVEDNSGKGFIIKKGTYIGLNAGIVSQINANSVVVEEELETLMGELTLQNTEIKLQKPAGE